MNDSELALFLYEAERSMTQGLEGARGGVRELLTRLADARAAGAPEAPIQPPITSPPAAEDLDVLRAATYQPGWGDVLQHKPSDGPTFILHDTELICGARSGAITHSQDPNPVTVDIHNVLLSQGPVTVGWGLCLNHVGGIIDGLTAVDLGVTIDGHKRDGHALYAKLLAALRIDNFEAIGCAGQAAQLVTRPKEGTVPISLDLTLGTVIAKDCSHQAVGHGGGGSAMLALYCASPGGTDIRAESITLVGTLGQPDKPKEQPATRGGIQTWADGHPLDSAWFNSFSCDELDIDMEQGDRHPLDFKDTDRVDLERIKGRLRGAHQVRDGLPVLINMAKTSRSGLLRVGYSDFPFAAVIDGITVKVAAKEEVVIEW